MGKLPSGVQGADAVGVGSLAPGGSMTTVPGPCLHIGCAVHVQKSLSVCCSQTDLLLAAVVVSLPTVSVLAEKPSLQSG